MVSRRSFVGQLGILAAAGPLLSEATLGQIARARADRKSDIVWLDSNENPAGPPASAIDAIVRGAAEVGRYHMEELDSFAQAIASSESVSPKQVLIGVGSSDVITAAICAFASASRPMITAAPSYDIVVTLARKLGREVIEVPLSRPTWAYPVKQLAGAAEKASGGLIYLCNPNNPTASLTPAQDIQWLVTNLPSNTVLFVDEAYLEFAEPGSIESAIRFVREDKNVVISRTFSKIYGMAGARAGFGCARPDLIAAMTDFMDNVIPILGLRAASAALGEKAMLIPERRKKNARIRGELCQWLREKDVSYIESHTNFVMIDVGRDVRVFGADMRSKGVAVGRRFPPLDHMLRVTIGTDGDMGRFRTAFGQVYRA
jgi:histidinol-phosphate aminotransferase